MKTIRNMTTLEQQVVVGSSIHTIAPFEEKPFPDAIANAFLADLPREIIAEVKGDAIGAVYDKPVEKPSTIWVANFMGDPDAPATVKVKVWDKDSKRYKFVDVDNAKRVARPVSREMGGAMEEYRDQEGLMARNKPPTLIVVPPYQRREMPAPIGNWFLTRDGNIQPEQFRGQVGLSRPRSAFEPDMNWDLDDMRCYLQMTDRKAILGPTKKEIAAANPDKSAQELAIYEAKLLCMKRLHFRLAKASARVYSQSEFEEFRRGFEKPPVTVSAEQAAAAVKKNLGPASSSTSL